MPRWAEKIIATWGVLWVVALLAQATYRLTPLAIEPWRDGLMTPWHKTLYIGWVVLNGYLEGYRAFQLKFCPRVMSRAVYLGRNPRPLWVILALPFCMSLFHSARRQKIASWTLVIVLVFVVAAVRALPQPWRGIIDGGVVVGLAWGVIVLIGLWLRYLMNDTSPAPSDIPPIRRSGRAVREGGKSALGPG